MPNLTTKYHQPLLPGNTYHLFSRAIGDDKIFVCDENYRFFLAKLKGYTNCVCTLYAYTLIPNHFHLLVKIHTNDQLIRCYEDTYDVDYHVMNHDLSAFVMKKFSNFLNCYAKSFNSIYDRKGSLFIHRMCRTRITKESGFYKVLWYIHKNAVHHGLANEVGEWRYDSFNAILNEDHSNVSDEILKWFGGKREYIQFHERVITRKVKSLGKERWFEVNNTNPGIEKIDLGGL